MPEKQESPAIEPRSRTRDDRAPPRSRDWLLGWTWWIKERVLPGYVSEAAPIVVGGCGRSGTTLLQVMLDRHPDISCARESSILHSGKLDTSKLSSRTGLPVERVRVLADTSSRHGKFVDRMIQEMIEDSAKPRWADKSPRNVRRLKYVFKHFPKARFVHVIRDGRDAACSLRTHPKFKRIDGEFVDIGTFKPFADGVRRWKDDVSAGIGWRGHERYHEIRYEDLVTEPEPHLRRLFEFLGTTYTPEVMGFHEVSHPSAKDPGFEKPLYNSSVARWKKRMSPEDVAIFKQIAGPLLIQMGYEPDNDWQSDSETSS